jgi:histidinol-phosphate aminotransferase
MARLPMSDSLAYRKMMTRGVMVRTMTGFRFPNWIRITISHQEALEAFAEAMHGILRERGES